MRLTRKYDAVPKLKIPEGYGPNIDYNYNNVFPIRVISDEEIIAKLGQLEDIEEELGIGLITLFKIKTVWCIALVEDKQTKERSYQIIERKLWGINIEDKKIMVGSPYRFLEYPIKEFGITWALTREELERR